jgi:hypothetical protein
LLRELATIERRWREDNAGGYKLLREAKELFSRTPIQFTDNYLSPAKYRNKFSVYNLKRKN